MQGTDAPCQCRLCLHLSLHANVQGSDIVYSDAAAGLQDQYTRAVNLHPSVVLMCAGHAMHVAFNHVCSIIRCLVETG